eukprot:m.139948 g.139948  ORF g.139948 m.139948 type:complete len:106 (+) comp14029_c1_seq2:120-437(+)
MRRVHLKPSDFTTLGYFFQQRGRETIPSTPSKHVPCKHTLINDVATLGCGTCGLVHLCWVYYVVLQARVLQVMVQAGRLIPGDSRPKQSLGPFPTKYTLPRWVNR